MVMQRMQNVSSWRDGKILQNAIKVCALTASRRHARPRTQPQTAGRRRFLDLKNRRSRACASGAYSVYVRMAHERDRRFLWLKSDGSSPTLTESRAHKPTIHAFRDRVHNRISRKLRSRTHGPIKSLTRPRRGCTRMSNTKTYPTKTNEMKAETILTSNYTKHNRKRQGTERRPITTDQNAARRITIERATSEARGIKHKFRR